MKKNLASVLVSLHLAAVFLCLIATTSYGQVKGSREAYSTIVNAKKAASRERTIELSATRPQTIQDDKPVPDDITIDDLSESERSYVNYRLQDNPHSLKVNSGFRESWRIGQIGEVVRNANSQVIHLNQVVDEDEMLVFGYQIWIQGLSTEGLVDDSNISLAGIVFVVAGTKQYKTAISTRTVMHLVTRDWSRAETVLAKIGQKRKEEKKAAAAELAERKHAARTRTWTSGKYTVEAEFLNFMAGTVFLRRVDNGKEISVQIDSLSNEDQQFIREKKWRVP